MKAILWSVYKSFQTFTMFICIGLKPKLTRNWLRIPFKYTKKPYVSIIRIPKHMSNFPIFTWKLTCTKTPYAFSNKAFLTLSILSQFQPKSLKITKFSNSLSTHKSHHILIEYNKIAVKKVPKLFGFLGLYKKKKTT